ncbi:hypothetical protein FB45DRAFT_874235 [Roridomyces roridus]|uniref:NADAR domain-containing protein n=1 Tax=Roridomyces roridus TaxID=1738132 RepID=A0AAD7B9N0_9AGAR|nr:hypothetical protein FB45DRAFT_874235 [Roridomyces roridus]
MVSPWSDSPDPPSPASPITVTSPMHYRIEQRRSVYITTDILPDQWDTAQLNHLLDLGEKKPDGEESNREIRIRLTRSMPDRPVVFYPELEPKPASEILEVPRPRSTMYHRSREPKVDGGIRASTVSPTSGRRAGGTSPRTPTRGRVLFYHKSDPHYGFTNFSAHPVIYDNKRYPTSEHLFQSFKFQPHRPQLAEHIRTCSERPSVAFAEARRFQPEVRSDWKDVNIQMMDLALWHKFTQHESLKKELLATEDAELVEDSDKDSFWGIGADRRGRNELGKALERLRTKLRDL